MTCERCKADPQPKGFGQPRECAFESSSLSSDNWRCATIDELRKRVDWMFRGDHSIGVVRIPEADCGERFEWLNDGFVVLTWTKMRGRVNCARVFGGYSDSDSELTLELADEILRRIQ